VGDGLTQAAGMEPPVHHYATSAALTGIAFYTGAAFPRWRNNLFVGAMTPKFLSRLVITNGRVVSEERLLTEKAWRVRVVQTGPDGFIYIGVQRASDGTGGVIARICPVPRSISISFLRRSERSERSAFRISESRKASRLR
jgi:glucose/arabinose dehydrogenase